MRMDWRATARGCGSLSRGQSLMSALLESTNCPGSGERRTLLEHCQVEKERERDDGKSGRGGSLGVEEGCCEFYLYSNATTVLCLL